MLRLKACTSGNLQCRDGGRKLGGGGFDIEGWGESHMYIYIYIERERERDRYCMCTQQLQSPLMLAEFEHMQATFVRPGVTCSTASRQ